jgi:hypothetical protein
VVTGLDLPRKLAEREGRRRNGRLKMFESLVVVFDGRRIAAGKLVRHAFHDGHVVPVAVVLGEVSKATLGVP